MDILIRAFVVSLILDIISLILQYYRMAIAGWVANEAIPGALPVWHP